MKMKIVYSCLKVNLLKNIANDRYIYNKCWNGNKKKTDNYRKKKFIANKK